MKRQLVWLLALASPLFLEGCVYSLAAGAASAAVTAARGTPKSNEGRQPDARDACIARASQYGQVHVIDVQQERVDKIIVWGTADDGTRKQSFQCNFGTKITGFTLRPISGPR